MVTDYDCWHTGHEAVTVEQVIKVVVENADKGRALIKQAVHKLVGRTHTCPQGCQTALDVAIQTAPEARDPAMAKKLDAIAGRVLKG